MKQVTEKPHLKLNVTRGCAGVWGVGICHHDYSSSWESPQTLLVRSSKFSPASGSACGRATPTTSEIDDKSADVINLSNFISSLLSSILAPRGFFRTDLRCSRSVSAIEAWGISAINLRLALSSSKALEVKHLGY